MWYSRGWRPNRRWDWGFGLDEVGTSSALLVSCSSGFSFYIVSRNLSTPSRILFCTVQPFPYFLLRFLHTGVCRYGWFSAVQMPVHLNCSKDVTFSCTTPHVSWRDEPFRICYEQLDCSVIIIAFAIDLRNLMAQAFCGQEWSPKWRLERNSRLNGRSGSWPSRK